MRTLRSIALLSWAFQTNHRVIRTENFKGNRTNIRTMNITFYCTRQKISIFAACITFTSCIKLSKLRFGARLVKWIDVWERKAVTWERSINRLVVASSLLYTHWEKLLFIVRRQHNEFRSEITKPTSPFHRLWTLQILCCYVMLSLYSILTQNCMGQRPELTIRWPQDHSNSSR
jgi:hypothetical protein